ERDEARAALERLMDWISHSLETSERLPKSIADQARAALPGEKPYLTPSPKPRPSDREIAESWETLARSYETMLRALCDTEDPVAMLADWCAGAGLPAPKAASLQDARRAAIEAQWQHPG